MPLLDGRLSARATAIAAGAVATWAVLLVLITWSAKSDGTPYREIASLALGAAFFAVALAALAGEVRHAPWLVAAAGLALVPMSLITFSPAGLPFLLPAAFLASRGFGSTEKWPRTAGLTAAATAVLAVGAVATLFLHDDSAQWVANGIHYSSSDIITRTEAVVSLGLSAIAIFVAWFSPPSGIRR